MAKPDNAQAVPLGDGKLADLDPRVHVPGYERNKATASICHVVVGGFHRAHQAVYTDAVLAGGDLAWGICGVGITANDAAMESALAAQDRLYTLVARDRDTVDVRVIGSIVDYRLAAGSPAAVYLTEVLRALRSERRQPPMILCCDNLPHNGSRLKRLLMSYARELDPSLARYVEQDVSFPCAMVDRITPATREEDTAYLRGEYGIVDTWPVFCETFCQWIVEDNFSRGRPDW